MTKTMMITGVTGYFGSRIAVECLRLGWKVVAIGREAGESSAETRVRRAILRLDPGLEWMLGANLSVIAADITSLEGLRHGPVDAVVHVAADVKNADSAQTMLTNVVGTKNVLKWAEEHTENFVYIGTAYSSGRGPQALPALSVNEDSNTGAFNNDYEWSKSLAQAEVRKSPLNWTILRPSILTHEIDLDPVGVVEEPIGIHGWFRLAKTCHDIAVRMSIPIVRIPVHPQSFLDVVSAPAAARLVALVADSLSAQGHLSPFCSSETLIAGVSGITCSDVIDIAHDLGLHRIQMDASRDFEPSSLPEKVYCRQGGFFVSYARQHLRFDATRLRARFGEAVVKDLGQLDLKFCTGLRHDHVDLDIRMRKIIENIPHGDRNAD